jgi:hypothetical protein
MRSISWILRCGSEQQQTTHFFFSKNVLFFSMFRPKCEDETVFFRDNRTIIVYILSADDHGWLDPLWSSAAGQHL